MPVTGHQVPSRCSNSATNPEQAMTRAPSRIKLPEKPSALRVEEGQAEEIEADAVR